MLYADEVEAELGQRLLRMHIVADSNDDEAQAVKLSVRDAVLAASRENPSFENLENAARSELLKMGADYSARASIERCYVPEKCYKNLRLPEGIYNCFKVILGRGEGENWWCVAYPPLCFTEAVTGELSEEGGKQLEKLLSPEVLGVIVDSGGVNLRFKLLEEMKALKKYFKE